MSHKKIKIMAANAKQWDAIVAHARTLGAVSRDDAYAFNPEKTAMVVDDYYIKYSSTTMKTKAGFTPPMKISVDDFLALSSLHDIGNIGKPVVNCNAAVAAARKALVDATPALGKNMKITDCDILLQDDVIFASKGIDALKSLGVEVTMLGDTPYLIDVATNSAEPITTELVATKAKADILDGKTTPWMLYANQFELVTNVVSTKVLPEA